MSPNIDQIKIDFDAFCQRIDKYREHINTDLQLDKCRAAYEGLYNLIERIKKECKPNVGNSLQKTAEHTGITDR